MLSDQTDKAGMTNAAAQLPCNIRVSALYKVVESESFGSECLNSHTLEVHVYLSF